MAEPETASLPGRQVLLQRVFLKDCSLEVPLAPQIFSRPWTPVLDVQINSSISGIGEQLFQIILSVTVTAKLGEDTGFLAEVHQGGIFLVTGFENEAEIQAVLGGYCPNQIFPFVREAIAELTQRGSFPPVLLQPINFEGLYQEHVAKQLSAAAKEASGSGVVLQ
jgi:preprotein translocase subunit SecB